MRIIYEKTGGKLHPWDHDLLGNQNIQAKEVYLTKKIKDFFLKANFLFGICWELFFIFTSIKTQLSAATVILTFYISQLA